LNLYIKLSASALINLYIKLSMQYSLII
jgi:hypothetical protein